MERVVTNRMRRRVRVLALCVVGFFALQQFVIETRGEPFPGLVLPSFASKIQGDVVERRVPMIEAEFADGSVEVISERTIVGPSPGRPIHVMMTMFWHGADKVSEQEWKVEDRDTVRFVGRRIADQFPTRTATSLTVEWMNRAVRLDGTVDDERTQLLRRVHVDL